MNSLEKLKAQFNSQQVTKANYIQLMHQQHARLYEYSQFLKHTSVERIEISSDEVMMTMKGNGLKIIVNPEDHRIAPIDALNFGSYEQAETDMMLRLVNEGDSIFDIGANIGWYSLILAKKFSSIAIHAFEPIASTFEYLSRHVELNQAKSVKIYPFGFADKEADLVFYYYPEGSVNASLARMGDHAGTREIKCHVKKIDDFVKERKLKVDFIKCDVEGAELLVFKGGERVLAEQKPVVFTEMLRKWSAKFDYHPNEIIELFERLGYQCFSIKGEKLANFSKMNDETVETNFFFLHQEKHAEKIRNFSANGK